MEFCETLGLYVRNAFRRYVCDSVVISIPSLSVRGRKLEPGEFFYPFSHPWNNSSKFYGIKSPEYFSVCNFIPSTLRSMDRNSALNMGQCSMPVIRESYKGTGH
jgi:hypothetical protein